MTIAIDKTGIESVTILKIVWGVTTYLFADKAITAPIGVCEGRILQANVVSKTGQIGQSGVSKTASVTLDDTDGTLKSKYDTIVLEGSKCSIYQYIIQDTPVQRLLMSGIITSDIVWSEGERTLSFSIEGGTARTGQSSELGYAPVENAFVGLNPNAIGINWPIVFGTVAKVPAVRIEYYDDLTLAEQIDYDSVSFQINNGSQLPQSPTVIQLEIDRILFEGTMSDDIFTPSEKNLARYEGQVFAERIVDDDYNNPCVAWVPEDINLFGLFVYIEGSPIGDYTNQCIGQNGTKCFFAAPWFDGAALLDDDWAITEAARYCRTDWNTVLQLYSGNDTLIYTSGKDGWSIYRDAPVVYESGGDYTDRYVVNLYPSTDILAVWGKRKINEVTVWAKIPQLYYHIHLNEAIITNPGTVTRNVTVLDFPKPLRDYLCENWESNIYVTLESTLTPGAPREIFKWVTDNFTTFTWDAIFSDTPPVTMNFAYFETTDAIEFLKGIAYQSASAMQIIGNDLRLVFLAQLPVYPPRPIHTITDSLILTKTLELGFKTKEEVNTIHRAKYVTDYSGEKTATVLYEVNQNVTAYGTQVKEDDMWALTCASAVEAVTNFWCVKSGNSWKTAKLDCFLDLSDAEVFDGVEFDIANFIPAAVRGLITSVVHDTSRPMVHIEVELAVPAGDDEEDPDYWDLDDATCDNPTDTEEDYVPTLDPMCPTWSTDIGATTPRDRFHVVIMAWPPRIFRYVPFALNLEIHNTENILQEINMSANAKIYTTNPRDCFVIKEGVTFTAGLASIVGKIKGSMYPGKVHLNIKPINEKRVQSGDVITYRPKHL